MMRRVELPIKARKVDTGYGHKDFRDVREFVKVPSIKSMIKQTCAEMKQHASQFDMNQFHGQKKVGCNTTHCAAGWISVLFNPAYKSNVRAAQRDRLAEIKKDMMFPSETPELESFDPAEEFAIEALLPAPKMFIYGTGYNIVDDARKSLHNIFYTTHDGNGKPLTVDVVASKLKAYGEMYG